MLGGGRHAPRAVEKFAGIPHDWASTDGLKLDLGIERMDETQEPVTDKKKMPRCSGDAAEQRLSEPRIPGREVREVVQNQDAAPLGRDAEVRQAFVQGIEVTAVIRRKREDGRERIMHVI